VRLCAGDVLTMTFVKDSLVILTNSARKHFLEMWKYYMSNGLDQ